MSCFIFLIFFQSCLTFKCVSYYFYCINSRFVLFDVSYLIIFLNVCSVFNYVLFNFLVPNICSCKFCSFRIVSYLLVCSYFYVFILFYFIPFVLFHYFIMSLRLVKAQSAQATLGPSYQAPTANPSRPTTQTAQGGPSPSPSPTDCRAQPT